FPGYFLQAVPGRDPGGCRRGRRGAHRTDQHHFRPGHRSIALDSVVSKLSAGAVEYIPVARVTNLAQTLRELKEDHGFWVCGTDMEGSVPYDEADYSGPLVIVVGSEGDGMRKGIRSECDFMVHIPMYGHVNSLNAAVATGIIVYEAVKCRNKRGG
ncbi:MAG: RNA methyltransferase, partial [Clostridiales bacterium]|nr:RNA methyltransferase [Clostridiales bacterium]